MGFQWQCDFEQHKNKKTTMILNLQIYLDYVNACFLFLTRVDNSQTQRGSQCEGVISSTRSSTSEHLLSFFTFGLVFSFFLFYFQRVASHWAHFESCRWSCSRIWVRSLSKHFVCEVPTRRPVVIERSPLTFCPVDSQRRGFLQLFASALTR